MSSAASLLNERIGEVFAELTDIAARAEAAAQKGVQVAASSVVSHKRLELFFAVFWRFDRAAVEPGLICSKV